MSAAPSGQRAGEAPALSVIVPAFNRASMLPRTIGSLLNQSLAPHLYEILVVDDGSTDETPEVVRALAEQDARVQSVRLPTNRGISGARNAGILRARGAVVVFVDSDVFVRPDFLAAHLDAHRSAGGPILCRGPVVPVPDFHMPDRLPLIALSPAYLDGANFSLPRQIIVAVGSFDEGFGLYGWEDFDLGLRLQRRGLRRVFRREAVAFHVQPLPSPEAFAAALRKEDDRARTAVYLYQKHPGWSTRLLIQHTRAHRAAFFLLTLGGLLNSATVSRLAGGLQRRGFAWLADLVVRIVLHHYYLQALHRQWQAAGLAGPHPAPSR